MIGRRLAAVLALCLGASPAAAQPARGAEFPPPAPDSLVVGPLLVQCRPGEEGIVVTCLLNLSAVLVGARTLTPAEPSYDFDVQAGNAAAKGTLSATFVPAGQLSTAQASLRVTIPEQRPIAYRGTFLYWRAARLAVNGPGPRRAKVAVHPDPAGPDRLALSGSPARGAAPPSAPSPIGTPSGGRTPPRARAAISTRGSATAVPNPPHFTRCAGAADMSATTSPTGPVTLPAYSPAPQVTVTVTPSGPGLTDATVQIQVNDTGAPVWAAMLTPASPAATATLTLGGASMEATFTLVIPSAVDREVRVNGWISSGGGVVPIDATVASWTSRGAS